MRQSHLILSNAMIMWVARVFLLVPQVVLVPYLIGTIGEEGYGLYALIWSLLLSVVNLEIALQQGVVKYGAGYLAQGRLNEVNKVVSSSFVYSMFLAVATCAGMVLASLLFTNPAEPMRTALFVVGLVVLFLVPLTPYIAIIQSKQRYYVGAALDTASKYLSLLAVVVWFRLAGPSITAVIVLTAGFLFLSRATQVPIAHRLVPGLRNQRRFFCWNSFRLIAKFGGATALVNLSLAANSTGIRWLMGALVSTSFVAHLAIMLMPALLLSDIIRPMTITVMPLTSAYEATGNKSMLKELLIRGVRYTAIFALAGVIAAGLLAKSVLTLWVGSRYVFLAPYTFALFACISFQLSTAPAHHILKGMGRLKTVVLIYSFSLVLLPVGLILILFAATRDPYLSVTAGLCAGSLVCGWLNLASGLKAVGTVRRGIWWRAYGQSGIVLVAVAVVAFGITALSGSEGFLNRAGITILCLLLYFTGCYFWVAKPSERTQFKEYLRMVRCRVTAWAKKQGGRKKQN